MKNQNERLGQVKSELNRLGRNEAIVKEEEEFKVKMVALLTKIFDKEKAIPRALPSKKKQYLFAEKLAYRYRRLYLKNPKLRALFYDGDNDQKAHSPLDQFALVFSNELPFIRGVLVYLLIVFTADWTFHRVYLPKIQTNWQEIALREALKKGLPVSVKGPYGTTIMVEGSKCTCTCTCLKEKKDGRKDQDPKAQSPLDPFASVPPTRNLLFAAILSICASSSKKISIYNEEMIVARCFIGFIIFSRKSLGKTFKMTLDGRIQAIQEESQQFPNPNEVVPPESNEQQRLLRISLRICGTVVESLPMARCAPKCEKTVQAFLCRNLNVKSATLPNATSSRRIRLQDDLVTAFYLSVSERFVPGSTLKVSIVELIQEGLGVLKMGGSLKNKENE